MITLKNKNVTAEISETGAELKSLKLEGKEYMWSSAPEFWNCSAPNLFPICGGLRDDKFIYEGKEYFLPKHGFAKISLFEVEKSTETSATFLLKANEETLKMYPFDFELRIIYTLTKSGVKLTYKVDNKGEKEMYFSIGSHEGYLTPEGIEDYDIIFPKKETLNATLLDGNLLQTNTLPIIKDTNVLPLYDKYFIVDALVFKDLQSRSATLRNRKTGRFVKVDFPDKPYFVIWHKHGSPFMCLEPWCGVQDPQDSDYDLSKKEGIITLSAGKTYSIAHTITVG